MQSSETKQFKPGFLSSLNRSFRIKSSHQPTSVTKKDTPDPRPMVRPEEETFGPSAFSSVPSYGEEETGTFRRSYSINANRKQHQRLVRIPEMPLRGDLLKKVWNDGLENSTGSKELDIDSSKPLLNEIATPRIDSYRFSMANLEDSQEVDLDAILSQLCALESKCDEEIRRNSYSTTISNGEKSSVISTNCHQNVHPQPLIPATPQRTDSPDNDSAFSDTVSMLSSESSTSSSGASAPNKIHQQLQLNLNNNKDIAVQAKAEKIRLALEKMVKASVKKLFIKAFSVDGSSKSLLIDEKMTCGHVTRLLADKNHVAMEPKWAIVEYLTELQMERIFEDHEILVDNLMLWARDSKNKIFFAERPEKTSLFQNPETYLISENDKSFHRDYDDHSRSVLIEEFFNNTNAQNVTQPMKSEILSFSNHPVPPMEGPLYLKSDSKKGWKKYHFVLKSCGLYYSKDKAKSKDVVSLTSFEVNEIYIGINWKKKHKAPTDFCFALKHPRLQQPKCVKFVKFLCAEDKKTFDKWLVAMRIAKHGRQLLDNYRTLADDLAQEDLDQLANARSCSVMSILQNNHGTPRRTMMDSPGIDMVNKAIYTEGSITGSSDLSSGRHSCISSSSSSGCMSDGGPSGSEGNMFDSEFSTGTIKRKPSMKPNIPLTSMTRQLKEMVDSDESSIYSNVNISNDTSTSGSNNNTFAYTSTGTLTRRNNRRKSIQSNNTDESSSGSGTLKRHNIKNNRGSSESMTSCNSSNSGSNTPSKTMTRDQYPTPNGNQSPEIRIQHQNRDTLASTGILLGYLTQQTVVPSHDYLTDHGAKSSSGQEVPFEDNSKLGQPQNFYATPNQPSFKPNVDQSSSNSQEMYDDIDNIQNMPLPPPPNFLSDEMSFNFDPMFSSTLSLESLPPPPPPDVQSLSCNNLSESQLSLMSLPPPPSLSDFSLNIDENYDARKTNPVEKIYDTSKDCSAQNEFASPQSISEKIEFYNATNRLSSVSQENKEKDQNPTFRSPVTNKQELITKPKISLLGSPGVAAIQSSLQNKSIYCNVTSVDYGHFPTNTNLKQENAINMFNPNINNIQPEIYSSNHFNEQKRIQNQISSPVTLRKSVPNKIDDGILKDDSDVKSPILRRKQVSFNDTPSPINLSMPKKKSNTILSDPQSMICSSKPPPPKRNENTRLSSPVKLADSSSNPPVDFLKDLQRVMRKKWQVAQKCKLEPTTTPHEVLGFREYPILSEDYREANVSNWVQEHYGHSGLVNPPNVYENITSKQNDKPADYVESRYSVSSSNHDGSIGSKKRPPPPIPKRSENTQLTAVSVHKSH